jgi:hypothetical protein
MSSTPSQQDNSALNVLAKTATSDDELRNRHTATKHASRYSGGNMGQYNNDFASTVTKEGSDDGRGGSDGSSSSRKASGRKAKKDGLRRGKWMVSRRRIRS